MEKPSTVAPYSHPQCSNGRRFLVTFLKRFTNRTYRLFSHDSSADSAMSSTCVVAIGVTVCPFSNLLICLSPFQMIMFSSRLLAMPFCSLANS